MINVAKNFIGQVVESTTPRNVSKKAEDLKDDEDDEAEVI